MSSGMISHNTLKTAIGRKDVTQPKVRRFLLESKQTIKLEEKIMRKFYFIMFVFAFALCLGNVSKAQNQNTNDNLIFNADNISSLGGGQFTYSNQNTSVFGRLREGNFGPSNCLCNSGTTLNLRSRFSGELSIRGGNPGLVNENLYNQVFFTGSLFFDGGDYVLPLRYDRSRFDVTLPATLTGSLSGYTADPFSQPTPPIFASQFNLQGTVKVTLQVTRLVQTLNGVTSYYKIHNVRYDFPRTSQNVQENSEILINHDTPNN